MMQKKTQTYDYIILGAGPAGLQLSYFFEKANFSYLTLERGSSPGSFFKTFPRHRKLISINKIHTGYSNPELNLRWDWNSLLTKDYQLLLKHHTTKYFPQAASLLEYLDSFHKAYHLNIKFNTEITRVSKNSNFTLRDNEKNKYVCKRLIIATGVSKPFIPKINGVELTENYFNTSVNPKDFINQRVLIIGKGNSAFETADNLIGHASSIHLASPNSIEFAWRSHFVGHLRAINNNLLDTYQLKSQNALLDADIKKISRVKGQFKVNVSYKHAGGEKETLYYDRIITCAGFMFDNSIFDKKTRPKLTIHDKLPKLTSSWESNNIKNLYFAGVLTQSLDYKKSTSAFIHGFRYNCLGLYHILAKKHHKKTWPNQKTKLTPANLTQAVISRINESSSMWQQFGFIGDLVVLNTNEKYFKYYSDLPIGYVHDSEFGKNAHYYTITLEYGPHHVFSDPFKVTRVSRDDVENSDQSHFLHPVIRRFNKTKLVATHHIIEDLASEWKEDVHIKPLLKFFIKQTSFTKKTPQATPRHASI